jgi:uncharacterized protein YggE
MKTKYLISFLLSFFFIFGCSQSSTRTITVQGNGSVSFVPDIIELSVNVSYTEPKLTDALSKTKSTINTIQEITQKYKIEENDIKTSNVESNKAYNTYRDVETFIGYRSSQTTRITIRKISDFESFSNDLMGAGIYSIDDVTFTHSKIKEYTDEANLKALQDADRIADNMTKEMKIIKGKILYINNTTESSIYGASGYSSYSYNKGLFSGGISISTGIMEVNKLVIVTYEIK